MSRRYLLPALAATAVAATGIAANADGAASDPTSTYTLRPPARRDAAKVDVTPKGLSAGDEFIQAATLTAGGHAAGRIHAVCTIVDRSYRGQDCRMVVILRGGEIVAEGGGLDRTMRGVGDGSPGTGDTFAVTGGTGTYAGASGTLNVRQGTRVTLRLIR